MDDIFNFEPNHNTEFAAFKNKNDRKEEIKNTEGQLTLDVYQEENAIVIKSTIAGVSAGDIDISITSDMVVIKGERKKDHSVKSSDYYYQELYWGRFSRSVILPVDIDPDKAKASMKNGILIIRLPMLEKSKSKRMPIE